MPELSQAMAEEVEDFNRSRTLGQLKSKKESLSRKISSASSWKKNMAGQIKELNEKKKSDIRNSLKKAFFE